MISDEKLRLALEEYDKAILEALPEDWEHDHQFSRRFERKMRGVCRRAKHPVAYKVLQRAACVLLAMLALFGGVMAFNAEARAAVIDWINEQIGRFSHYFYAGETTPEPQKPKRYELAWLPDGYMLINSLTREDGEIHVYINQSGQLMQFHYYHGTTADPFLDEKDYTHKTVSVGHHTADIYTALDSSKGNGIVWIDSETGVLFCISAAVNEEDLMKLAESVTERN